MNMYYTDMTIDFKCTMRELYIIIYNHYHQLQFNKNVSCVLYELHSLPLLIVDVCDGISDTGVLSTG